MQSRSGKVEAGCFHAIDEALQGSLVIGRIVAGQRLPAELRVEVARLGHVQLCVVQLTGDAQQAGQTLTFMGRCVLPDRSDENHGKPMDHKLLGRTGIHVSKFCFGTMSFGGDADANEAARMYAACRERGFNFFDCADGYSGGRAEEILGGLIAGHRDELVLASKCFNPTSTDINDRGGTRRHIPRAVEASLKRLGTDRLDILFMHRFEASTPVEETLRALEDLVRAGKVIYLGASNYAAWQIAKSLGAAEKRGWTRFDVVQPMYNLVKRQAEVEIFPLAEAERLAVVTYSPVGGGLLSGKFRPGAKPNEGRLVENNSYVRRYGEPWMLETAGKFSELAAAEGVHPVTLAVAWTAAHPAVTCPIIGARSLEQLMPSLAALDFDMPAEVRDRISALSRRPPPATDRDEVLAPDAV